MPPQQAAVSPRRSLDTISIFALCSTLVLTLFVVLPSSAIPAPATKTFILAAGTLITLALYILARLGRGNVVFPSSLLLGALWLPALAYAFSAVFSGHSFMNALWGTVLEADTLGFMLAVAGLGTLTALALRRPEHYGIFLKVAAYAFGALAVVQLITIIIGQFSPQTVSPVFSVMGTYTDLALVLGLGVIGVLVAFRFLEITGRTHRLLLGAGATSLAVLAIANSSLVWVLLALASLGFFVEAVMRRGKSVESDLDDSVVMTETPVESEEGNHSLVLPLAVLAVSLFFLIGGNLGGALASALDVNIVNVRPSWQSTLNVGQKVYESSPLFGSGPGTFGVEWLKYRDAALNSTIFWNTNFFSGIGFLPTSFVTVGVVGAIAWLAFLALLIVFGLRLLILKTPQDPFIRYVSIFSFIAAIYLFTVAVFEVPGPLPLALAFVFAGLFVSTTRYGVDGRQWGVIFSRSPRIGFLIVFCLTILLLASVVAAYTLVGRYVGATHLAQAAVSLGNNNLDAADQSAQSSLTFAPSAIAYKLQSNVANARLNQIISSTTMERTAAQRAYQSALTAGINAALTSTKLDPTDYQGWIALGNLYAQAVPLGVTGSYESAKTAYEKAKELNPTNPEIPYTLAQLALANQDVKTADKELRAAITLKQDYTPAIFLLSRLEVQNGNLRGALDAALAAAYFTPDNPNILFQVGILYAAQGDFANAAAALEAAIAANQQFANARYFLSAVYVKQNNYQNAVAQMQAVADMSAENAQAVASQLAALKAGKNPFPANLLTLPSNTVRP